MKIFKKIIIIILILLLLLGLTIGFFSKAISPKMVKDYVNKELGAMTAQPSRIDGDISWQLLPKPGIKVTSVHSVNNKADNYPYTFNLNSLIFYLKLSPLLHGSLVFSEIKIDGLTLDINLNNQSVKKIKQPESVTSNKSNKFQNKLAIEQFELQHGQINFNHSRYKSALSAIQINAEHINLAGAPFKLQLKAALNHSDKGKPAATGQIMFKGSTSLSPELLHNPATALQNIYLAGELTVQNLQFNQVKINHLSAPAALKNGIFQLNPLTISLYQGESAGDLLYQIPAQTLQLNLIASGISIEKLSQDVLNQQLISGKASFSLHSKSRLNQQDWLAATTGNGTVTIHDGKLTTININRIIEQISNKINFLLHNKKINIKSLLNPESFINSEFSGAGTAFTVMTMQYKLENAVLTANNLNLQTDLLQVKGKTRVNLKNYAINSNLQAALNVKDDKILAVQQLLGGNFPLIVSGYITKPLILPDFTQIYPLVTQLWLKDKLTQPVNELKEQLKNLF